MTNAYYSMSMLMNILAKQSHILAQILYCNVFYCFAGYDPYYRQQRGYADYYDGYRYYDEYGRRCR